MIMFQLPMSPSSTLITRRLDSLEVVQSTTSEPIQTGMGHDTLDSVKSVQVLVQSDLEQGSGSLSEKTGIEKVQRGIRSCSRVRQSYVEVWLTERYWTLRKSPAERATGQSRRTRTHVTTPLTWWSRPKSRSRFGRSSRRTWRWLSPCC